MSTSLYLDQENTLQETAHVRGKEVVGIPDACSRTEFGSLFGKYISLQTKESRKEALKIAKNGATFWL